MGNLCSCRRTRPRLNARDALELSPFEKWRHFGIFPVKLCLHMALVVLVTAQVNTRTGQWPITRPFSAIFMCYGQAYMINDHYAAYSRAVGRNFVNIFFPSDQATTTVADFSYQLFTIRDTLDDTKRILTTYFQVRQFWLSCHRCSGAFGALKEGRWDCRCVQLPEVSVDAVEVATPESEGPLPVQSLHACM